MRTGFSLVQLLVVVGILALLAALLFPVFTSVRRSARMTACASNLHQIALALRMYANDNDGQYPPNNTYVRDMVRNQGQLAWRLLVPYTHDPRVFHCPDEQGRFRLGYDYRVGLRTSPTDPITKPPNPGSGTVVAFCGEHTERIGPDGWALDAQGRVIGPLVVVREDGSTARIQADRMENWAYQAGEWRQLGEMDCPPEAYCAIRFPDEEWPPQFGQ